LKRALLLVGWLVVVGGPPRAWADDVLVFAAMSLTEPLEEIAKAYQVNSGETVGFSFGGSNDLAGQIKKGAPADVFFSADTAQMDAVEEAALVKHAERLDLLSNVLVVVVPANSMLRLAGPEDLKQLKRIALADPEAVPAGVYARKYLSSVGLWDELRAKIIPALNVRAALSVVESEAAEAGLVYKTDAKASKRVKVAYEIPPSPSLKIVYPVAPLVTSKKLGAPRFVHYLASPAAKLIFEKHGFIVLDQGAPH
jgi:molybdate transport system substrate-binding protein